MPVVVAPGKGIGTKRLLLAVSRSFAIRDAMCSLLTLASGFVVVTDDEGLAIQ